jgi:Na+-driven multidrug efflux pump
MNNIQIYALLFNFILYLLFIIPIIIISLKKSIYKTKNNFLSALTFSTCIEIAFSLILYNFSKNIFSLFTKTQGIINYATYISRIFFISSSLYALKILIPSLFINLNKKNIIWNSNEKKFSNKKTAFLIISKITVSLLLFIIIYLIFNIKYALFVFPIIDFLYYFIYIILFLKVFR